MGARVYSNPRMFSVAKCWPSQVEKRVSGLGWRRDDLTHHGRAPLAQYRQVEKEVTK